MGENGPQLLPSYVRQILRHVFATLFFLGRLARERFFTPPFFCRIFWRGKCREVVFFHTGFETMVFQGRKICRKICRAKSVAVGGRLGAPKKSVAKICRKICRVFFVACPCPYASGIGLGVTTGVGAEGARPELRQRTCFRRPGRQGGKWGNTRLANVVAHSQSGFAFIGCPFPLGFPSICAQPPFPP